MQCERKRPDQWLWGFCGGDLDGTEVKCSSFSFHSFCINTSSLDGIELLKRKSIHFFYSFMPPLFQESFLTIHNTRKQTHTCTVYTIHCVHIQVLHIRAAKQQLQHRGDPSYLWLHLVQGCQGKVGIFNFWKIHEESISNPQVCVCGAVWGASPQIELNWKEFQQPRGRWGDRQADELISISVTISITITIANWKRQPVIVDRQRTCFLMQTRISGCE